MKNKLKHKITLENIIKPGGYKRINRLHLYRVRPLNLYWVTSSTFSGDV